jgi:PAT family acetyl-CoA transporter-like MFS transporter 1
MSKADIAMISPILLCMELILPAIVSQRVLSHPLDVYLLGQTTRIIIAIPLMWGALQYIHYVFQNNHEKHAELNYFDFFLLLGIMMINKAAGNVNFISMISFYSKISDPSIGGTYMTFLNALSNLSFKWTGVLSLWLLPKLTWKSCMLMQHNLPIDGSCDAHHGKECHDRGGVCITILDGYTVLMIFGFCFGLFWLYSFHTKIRQLQSLPASEWLISAVSKK